MSRVKLKCNEKFFEVPDLLNSYWAGFLAADGCVYKLSRLNLTLCGKDMVHLEKFKEDLNFEGRICKYNTKCKGKIYSACSININSEKLCADLEKNYLVKANKTGNIKFPTHLDDDFLFSYVLGYIDGDGSFPIRKQTNKLICIQITAEVEFLKDSNRFLSVYLEEPAEYFTISSSGLGEVYKKSRIQQRTVLEKIRKVVLENFDSLPLLRRKWNILYEADLRDDRRNNGKNRKNTPGT
jgi:hypothetical protein